MSDDSDIELPGSRAWRTAERSRLLDFAEGSRLDIGGFGYLDDHGVVDPAKGRELLVTARMTHCFALGALEGRSGAAALAAHGIAALRGAFRDDRYGGWFRVLAADSDTVLDDGKDCYLHAFVMLAASSGVQAGVSGSEALLVDATEVVLTHFWDEGARRMRESFSRDWSVEEAYRGANSNMHSVEACLAVAAATSDPAWVSRALSIAEHVVDVAARAQGWRLVEHFDASWAPLLDYNVDAPADPFRPYGTTVGHWLEWARLLIGVEAALDAADLSAPAWLLADATVLVDDAARVGWHADRSDGFVYTLNWEDRPVVRERMHWVLCEAIAAADALGRRTGRSDYLDLARSWWQQAENRFVDRVDGSWHHELDPQLRPSATVWAGKPDAYHALQATLLPDLSPGAVPAAALAASGRQSVGHSVDKGGDLVR